MLTLLKNSTYITRQMAAICTTTRKKRKSVAASVPPIAKNPKIDDNDIVWMDLEMTGLDVHKDKILEVSCLITDKDLNIKTKGLSLVINYGPDVLDNMNEWCLVNHKKSGLIDECLKSKIAPEEAEALLLEYLKQNVPKGKCPLAGNTIYMDRFFIREYWPKIDNYLHYRIIDVSTIKELTSRWNPELWKKAPQKKLKHRSLDDIEESIKELKFYRTTFFKNIDIDY